MSGTNKQAAVASTSTAVGRQQSTCQPSRNINVNLPNVQSKDTILTDFDYNQTFAKRKLESNWSKYDELPPEDDDNEQMMAANFEEMLLGPKTIGSHFTFSSEKHWDSMDAQDVQLQPAQIHGELFRLNLSSLKSGIDALPFDVRLGYAEHMFDSTEIVDISSRAGCFDRFVRVAGNAGKREVDLISVFAGIDAKSIVSAATRACQSSQSAGEIIKLQSTKNNRTSNLPAVLPSASNTEKIGSKSKSNVAQPAAEMTHSIENIQGWLDDILNNG